ncbi:MAG: O-antigen ligase family protein [Planctomycetota bacterium]
MIYLLSLIGLIGGLILGHMFGYLRVALIVLHLSIVGSLATKFPFIFEAKNLRVVLTVLVFLMSVYLVHRNRPSLNPLILCIWAFLIFFLLSSGWSETPLTALLYKGLFVAMAGAGVLWGWSQREGSDVTTNIRTLFLAHLIIVCAMWIAVVIDGGLVRIVSRMDPMGLNPIGVGEWGSLLAVFGVAMLLYEKKAWLLLAQVGVFLGCLTMLLSGSRGAVISAGLMVLITLGYRAKDFIVPILALIIPMLLLFYYLPELAEKDAIQRLGEADLSGRTAIWARGLEPFFESPLFGIGWLATIVNGRLSSENVHSIYITTLSETGLVGGILLLLMFLMVVYFSLMGYLGRQRNPTLRDVAYRIMAALAAFYFAKGIVESGPLYGTTTLPLIGFFAFASFASPAFTGRGTQSTVPATDPANR